MAKNLTHGGLEIEYPRMLLDGDVAVDGFAICVPAGKTALAVRALEMEGFAPTVLDGAMGDGEEEDVYVGSIDGDVRINLRAAVNALDSVRKWGGTVNTVEVNCHGTYEAAKAYMELRGYQELTYTVSRDYEITITGGLVNYSTSY